MARSTAFVCVWLAVLILNASCSYVRTNEEKRAEVERVWSNFPLPPDLHLLSSSSLTGFGKEVIAKTYRSDADPAKVKQFYVEKLVQDGWTLVPPAPDAANGSYELRFRKGDLTIAIEFAGRGADFGWDYGISVRWTRWRKN